MEKALTLLGTVFSSGFLKTVLTYSFINFNVSQYEWLLASQGRVTSVESVNDLKRNVNNNDTRNVIALTTSFIMNVGVVPCPSAKYMLT
jgi:hypothetical protein